MLLHNITLENFGAYKGKHTLDLTTRPGKPIILIGGLNGCGKTTLLDAIQLALYGNRARCSGRGSRSYDSYLRDSVNRQASPKRARLTLEFSITVEAEERLYRLVRSWRVSGNSVTEFLNVFVNDDLDNVISEGWTDHVEDILPLEVASLFFFDGEKIESLADPERAAPVIESAVHSLLGINTVQQLRTDLLALQRRNRVSDEDKAALAQIESLESQLADTDRICADATQRVASIRIEVDVANKHLQRADQAFSREGGDLYRRRAELEAEKAQAESQLQIVNDTLANIVAAGALPLLLLADQLDVVRVQVDQEEKAAQAEQVLGVLVDRDNEFMAALKGVVSAEQLARIERHLEADRSLRGSDTATERILRVSRPAVQQLNGLSEVLRHERERAQELLKEATALRERLSNLDRQLAGVPDETLIASLIKDRDNARHAVAQLEFELRTADEARQTVLRNRVVLNDARELAYRKRADDLARVEHADRLVSYSDRARTTLERFGDALLQRHISRLEVAVLDSFTRLMRKTGLVQDLKIDTAKFRLTLVGSDGDPLDPSRLSAGERQLLAVSLLWGLARVAGNRLPSVIDTPLGRLDSRHRQHLVERYFPHAGRQVLLLSTDEEIDEYLLARLKPAIAHTYTLVHDDTTFTTTVEPGYWWTPGAPYVA
jgi:DNA sulfur modification protein DndD